MHSSSESDYWIIRGGTTFLNHGSFGPTPAPVLEERIHWLKEFGGQPMDMLTRHLEPELEKVCESLAGFLGGQPDQFVLVPNATHAMNIVAANVSLAAGDEVLLNDHEYGAVFRIWGQKCSAAGARTVIARLPEPVCDRESLLESILDRVTPRTRLIVISHVTSATATIFPVQALCAKARELGIPVCIDGPHAIAMIPFRIDDLDCDYYCASCHKWLSGPLGTGFLWVRGKHKQGLKPAVVSWGRSLAGSPPSWKDEFHWSGTFDPSSFLAIPAAIRFLAETIGLDHFRTQTHLLAQYARNQICSTFGVEALAPDDPGWYGSMITIPLPHVPRGTAWPGTPHPLQNWLWERHGIEVPIMEWHDRNHIRVSCHLYNTRAQIDHLVAALLEWKPV